VANAQYLQCDTHERESESVTLREKVTRRRIRGSLRIRRRRPAPPAGPRPATRGGPRCHAGAAVARRPALALLLAALSLATAGCVGGRSGVGDANATLDLDAPPSAVDAGLYLALQRDYDGDEGLDMRLRTPASSADAVRRLLDGRARLALLDLHDLARARDRGRDLVAVMALVQRPLTAVLAAPGVRRPRDLDGRRVATRGGRADAAILAAVVGHDGGDPASVRRVRLHGDAATAVASGRVAAATGRWSTDGIRLLARSPKAHAFRADDYGAPAYPEIVLCVTRATLQDDRGVVRAAVNAIRRGYEEALVDPESAVGALVDAVPRLDRAATQDAFDAVSPAFLEGVTRFGDLDAARLRTWARWEARERIVRRPPDVARAFALGF
jgi:putative hydroxymethylpyrimidine transport system substrate-binding protein